MKRIKFLLSKWFLKLSKKLGTKSKNVPNKLYPNIDKISARFEISNDMINLYGSSLGQDYLEKEILKFFESKGKGKFNEKNAACYKRGVEAAKKVRE